MIAQQTSLLRYFVYNLDLSKTIALPSMHKHKRHLDYKINVSVTWLGVVPIKKERV